MKVGREAWMRIGPIRQRNDEGGNPRSGQAIRAKARDSTRGPLPPLAVGTSEVKLTQLL